MHRVRLVACTGRAPRALLVVLGLVWAEVAVLQSPSTVVSEVAAFLHRSQCSILVQCVAGVGHGRQRTVCRKRPAVVQVRELGRFADLTADQLSSFNAALNPESHLACLAAGVL